MYSNNKNNTHTNYFLIELENKVKNIKTLKDLDETELTETLLIHYFKGEQRTSEYKYIPKKLLEDRMFVYSIIDKNENVFHLLNQDLKKEVFEIFKFNKIDFIKYANDEEKANQDNIKLAMKNNQSNIFHLLSETITTQHVASYLKELDHYDSLSNLSLKNLAKILPEEMKTEEKFLYYFQLGSHKFILCAPETMRNDPRMARQILLRDPVAFKNIGQNLLNNDEFVSEILSNVINYIKKQSNDFNSFEYKILSKNNGKAKGINEFLLNINEKYLTESVCSILNENIKEIYTELSKEQQKTEHIVKSLFKTDGNKHTFENYSKLPKELKELKDLIKEYIKQERKKDRFVKDEHIANNVENIVNYYFLTKDYNLENHNNNKSPKQKI